MSPWSKGLHSDLQLPLSSFSAHISGALQVLSKTAFLKLSEGHHHLCFSRRMAEGQYSKGVALLYIDMMHRLPEAGDRKDADFSKLIWVLQNTCRIHVCYWFIQSISKHSTFSLYIFNPMCRHFSFVGIHFQDSLLFIAGFYFPLCSFTPLKIFSLLSQLYAHANCIHCHPRTELCLSALSSSYVKKDVPSLAYFYSCFLSIFYCIEAFPHFHVP